MSLRRILFVLLILVVLVVLRPSAVKSEVQRIYTQRDTIWRLLSLVVIVYLLYGLYTLWNGGYAW
ncbi:MAG: hypothetical protein KJZ86_21780 [Caldilineaceae bacterium]|nr:hypothetical protein [Caldilineaceae bacterium]HRJ43150.1 hypothetical protein [Caldilineaceae bacterium]